MFKFPIICTAELSSYISRHYQQGATLVQSQKFTDTKKT
jgi:hypothetical protein